MSQRSFKDAQNERMSGLARRSIKQANNEFANYDQIDSAYKRYLYLFADISSYILV
jgi:hypothetical protein